MKDFEQQLSRLEEIQQRIKESGVTLDESLQLFEEGMKLAKQLEKTLAEAEKRIEVLVSPDGGADDEPVFTPFESR